MTESTTILERLLHLTARYTTPHSGLMGCETPIPRLMVWSSISDTPPTSAVFEPMFYAVVQGTKVLHMGVNRFELAAGACAASSFGLPYSHELTGAAPELPYVGISLHLDVDMLTRVMRDMPHHAEQWACAVAASDLNGAVGDAFLRLVGLLDSPDDVGMLAHPYETELYYRLLQSPMGNTLRQIGQSNDRIRQIKAAADWLGVNNGKPVAISDLATSCGMSVTSFYRHFKAVTGYTPLAFQRHIRLSEARKLLAAGRANVAGVAYEVGYQSASQFSREYKKLFGHSPNADLQR